MTLKKSSSCSILPVSSCHATRRRQEGWDTAGSHRSRQGKSSGGGRVRTTDLPVATRGTRTVEKKQHIFGLLSKAYLLYCSTKLSQIVWTVMAKTPFSWASGHVENERIRVEDTPLI
ncbi:hypothetical protein T265_03693 [Opisthorchis viverrini]|uniref:Uncharacterized protein n=1 Tax=Opisthorchis viverrini TaxID=6198 RepID=A0A075AHF3_OPIVI|nr:hypothetical protein T265_03693 [Opisthorchis viverrini]KER29784.1 hypothetical protein T265_03693 [Opisthorchis viverrini]